MNDVMKIYEQLQGEWKKRVKPHKCVGMALEDDGLLLVEIHRRKETYSIAKKERFAFPEEVSWDRPRQLGEALKQFLRDGGFAARKTVVGIPTKWTMSREMTLPPSPANNIKGALKIHAEREFSLGPEDLVLDYTGEVRPNGPSRLLLSAMLKKRMFQIQEVARAAGLEVLSITPSSAVLFDLAGRNETAASRPGFALMLRKASAELLADTGEGVVSFRYFQRIPEAGPAFSAELHRTIFSIMKAYPGSGGEILWYWSRSADLEGGAFDIGEAMPPGMTAGVLPLSGILDEFGLSDDGEDAGPFAPGLALGLKAFREPAASVPDFLNSRMEARVGRIEKRHVKLAALATCVLVILLIGSIVSWKMNVNEVSELKENLAGMQADIDIAKNVVDKVAGAEKWYGGRPRVLDCLRELTLVFPEEGRIWTSSLALNEEMGGIISGKAVDEQGVIEVMDKMKKSSLFSDVQMIYMRDSGNGNQEISFSMSFIFEG